LPGGLEASEDTLLASATVSRLEFAAGAGPASWEPHPSHLEEAERRRRLVLEAGRVLPKRPAPLQESARAHPPTAPGEISATAAAAAASRPVTTGAATATNVAALVPADVSSSLTAAVNSSALALDRGQEQTISGVASISTAAPAVAALEAAATSEGARGSALYGVAATSTLAAAAWEGAARAVGPSVLDHNGRDAPDLYVDAESQRADLGTAAVGEESAQMRRSSLLDAERGYLLAAREERTFAQMPSAAGCTVVKSLPARSLLEVGESRASQSSQSWASETVVAKLPSLPAALAVDQVSQRLYFVEDSGQGATVLEWVDASPRTLLPARSAFSSASVGSVSLLVDGVRGWLFVLDQDASSGLLSVVDLADGFLIRSLPLAELGASGRGGAAMVLCPLAQFLVIGGGDPGLVVVDVHTWRSWRAASSAGSLPLAAITSLGVDARSNSVILVAVDPTGAIVVLRAPFAALTRAPPSRHDARGAALAARQLAAAESNISRLAREELPAGRASALLLLPEGRGRSGALAVHARASTWAQVELPAAGKRATVWTSGGAGPMYAALSAADGTALIVRLAAVVV
jgi:hypothetical protein